MRTIYSLAILLFSYGFGFAQNDGIHFENNKSWQEILKKAKADNKYVFVDCATTWCGPCNYMSKKIFPMDSVGRFYNANYIPVEFQMDTTTHDNEEIKARYGDAAFVSNTYKVVAYPTYLFFNPQGELVARELGSSTAQEFITKGENALNPAKQYYIQRKLYREGNHDSAFLRSLAQMATAATDDSASSIYSKAYFATQTNLMTPANMKLIILFTRKITDTGFSLMNNNLTEFGQIAPKDQLISNLQYILYKSESAGSAQRETWTDAQWQTYSQNMRTKYPLLAEDVLLHVKTACFEKKGDWKNYARAVDEYATADTLSSYQCNNFAWTVFTKSDDSLVLKSALVWSKESIADMKQPAVYNNIDTYANLLYKLGRRKEGLDWEVKARQMALADTGDKNWNQDTFDKMNQGKPTW